MAAVAPNAFFVNGRTSSSESVLGSVKKNKLTGTEVVEAGAFSSVPNGVCIIDDFDCLQLDHGTAIEALLHKV